jgi:hypothetical protein
MSATTDCLLIVIPYTTAKAIFITTATKYTTTGYQYTFISCTSDNVTTAHLTIANCLHLTWKIVALLAATALPAIIVRMFFILGLILTFQDPRISSQLNPATFLSCSNISHQIILHEILILCQLIPHQFISYQIIISINLTKSPVTAPTSSSSTTPLPSDNSWMDDPSSLTTHLNKVTIFKPATTPNPIRITILIYYFHMQRLVLLALVPPSPSLMEN